jgi:hypothetical protein
MCQTCMQHIPGSQAWPYGKTRMAFWDRCEPLAVHVCYAVTMYRMWPPDLWGCVLNPDRTKITDSDNLSNTNQAAELEKEDLAKETGQQRLSYTQWMAGLILLWANRTTQCKSPALFYICDSDSLFIVRIKKIPMQIMWIKWISSHAC